MNPAAYVPPAPSRPHRPVQGPMTALPVRLLLMVIAIAALSVSAFLAWVALTGQAVPGCGDSGFFNCDEVLSTQWSKWFNLPVALPAASLYAGILALLVFTFGFAPPNVRSGAWRMIGVLAACAALAGIWFIVLQGAIVKHWCPWCLAVHSSGVILALVVFAFAPAARRLPILTGLIAFCSVGLLVGGQLLSTPPVSYVEEEGFGITWEDGPAEDEATDPAVADVDPTLLAAADPEIQETSLPHRAERPVIEEQFEEASPATSNIGTEDIEAGETANNESEPSETDLQTIEGEDTPSDMPVEASEPQSAAPATTEPGEVETPVEAAEPIELAEPAMREQPSETESPAVAEEPAVVAPRRRMVTLAQGQPPINIYDYPILGSPDAQCVIFEMFDYTCPTCRRLAPKVEEAREKFGEDLAVVLLPLPMNGACNRFINGTDRHHTYACYYARYALAVWMAEPEEFEEYHHWLIEGDDPPSREEAQTRAARIVGSEFLDLTRGEDIASRIGASVELYGAWGRGTIPKLVIGNRTLSGNVSNDSRVFDLIEAQLSPASASE